MNNILDRQQMHECDMYTINDIGIPSMVLMERAALGVFDEIRARKIDSSNTLIVCGSGNNGGDGLALARMLADEGDKVNVYITGNTSLASGEMGKQYEIIRNYNVKILDTFPESDNYTLIVDAIFGIGLSRNIEGEIFNLIRKLNDKRGFKLSIDVPSGVNSDNGKIMGTTFKAELTVTIGDYKRGCFIYPGAEFCGEIVCKKIGISNKPIEKSKTGHILTIDDLNKIPKRKVRSNKGTYGNVLIIAGSLNMCGAAILAGAAAYASGCGLVRIFTPKDNRIIIQNKLPEAVLTTYDPQYFDDRVLEKEIERADSIVIGPGLGMDVSAGKITEYVLRYATVPIIADADALNIAATNPSLLKKHNCPLIITPHFAEMARLCDTKIYNISNDILETAIKFSKENNLICLLKDANSVIAGSDGSLYVNTSGNNGLSTAGSGDVLAGILGALAVIFDDYSLCAAMGAFIHGLAGDYAVAETGERGLVSSDIVEYVKKVLKDVK
ncbi:NAD(P)H-hydrate epimerase [Acetitomaculum ruminis DSM 5522]|uniref:Bifunctional NAD(P)H-hydrate repair enzyme n=1 Tax=Acetitomaculum ruminis DSM 5522 TaxID=1120918 RepID=A0A1I0V7F0_9FIRM|nr:NAD(P)H-hydrate dehydratase [Acetitomaculum ruminis]SFA72261.1 NAD(P)H-hydrate epimerase [Acetitomaculum ruminis DSM 5522]